MSRQELLIIADSGHDEKGFNPQSPTGGDVGVKSITDHQRPQSTGAMNGLEKQRRFRLPSDRVGPSPDRCSDGSDQCAVARGEAPRRGKGHVQVRGDPRQARSDRVGRLGEIPPADVRPVSLHDRDGPAVKR